MKIGDCFCIPLPNGKWAYCQYVYRLEKFGALVQIFDRITEEALDSAATIEGAGCVLPPVFVFLQDATRRGGWRRIGNLPVNAFEFPLFRLTMGTKPGVYKDWRIWDGRETTYIGELPESMRSLELRCIWSSDAIAERITDGTYRGDQMF